MYGLSNKARMMKHTGIVLVALALLLLTCVAHTQAAEVLYLRRAGSESPVEARLKIAAQFYGLELRSLEVTSGRAGVEQLRGMKKDRLRALFLDANTLSVFEGNATTSLLAVLPSRLPIMIAGVNAAMDPTDLVRWSKGAVLSSARVDGLSAGKFATDSTLNAITRQLSGQTIPSRIRQAARLNVARHGAVSPILSIISQDGSTNSPVLVLTRVGVRDVFFLGEYEIVKGDVWNVDYRSAAIWEMVPLMMFLRYACKDQCWHSPGRYANFTIDDPWLAEPYGHLSYVGLLEQMRKVNFHTTIAFIPWNYDRSHSDVVKLFQENPDKFSISIHGNNHDWGEFYTDQSSLAQETKIREAVARMERFTKATGIPYDKVVVFPRGVAPPGAFPILKTQNFLATVNFSNIPIGTAAPTELLFYLRPVSLNFSNFPTVKRYSADSLSSAEIALQLFLDNPIIFYTHHDFFKMGMDAFNSVAITANQIEPDLHWVSLGQLAKRLYVQRAIGKDEYEVLSFSPTIYLDNPHPRPVRFVVRKQESFSIPIRSVKVDGNQQNGLALQHEVLLSVRLQPGQGRTVSIEYDDGATVADVPILKKSRWVHLQRWLADFRDLTLSRSAVGRTIIELHSTLKNGALKFAMIALFLIGTGLALGIWYVRRRRANR